MTTLRKLTEDELEYILDFIEPRRGIPFETSQSVYLQIKNKLKKQLCEQIIHPSIIDDLKAEMEKMYHLTLIEPGESVGILTAQCLGEKNTQSTLNTFHKAGSGNKTVVDGVPRFKEMLNATKSPKGPSCNVYFKEGTQSVQELRKVINRSLVYLDVKSLASEISVAYDCDEKPFYSVYKMIYGDEFNFQLRHCIQIQFNPSLLFEYDLTLEDIANAIENEYGDIKCIFSSLRECKMDVYINTETITVPESMQKIIRPGTEMSTFIEEATLPALEKLHVCGIPDIDAIFYSRKDDNWYIETEGSNFSDILALPSVDMENTMTNNMWEVLNVLGIEATRQFLIEEFINIMSGINVCHVKLLADRMTYGGTISSISRYSMRTEGSGALSKASFEESLENLLNAALNGERETTNGVSSSIICGKLGKFGTGLCELKIDISKAYQNNTPYDLF